MPNQIGPHLGQRLIAFALANAGFGARRISAELAREKWGGIRSPSTGSGGCCGVFGLNTRSSRLALIARHRDPYERKPASPPPERHIGSASPGEVDRLTNGRVPGDIVLAARKTRTVR